MTQHWYLEEIFKPYIERAWREAQAKGEDFILQEDNDQGHSTRSRTNPVALYKQQIGIPCYANPPQSPDLSIIENCWRILKQRRKQTRKPPPTPDDLIELLQTEWWAIDQDCDGSNKCL